MDRMHDREALAEACSSAINRAEKGRVTVDMPGPIWDAARKTLAQLPEKCGNAWHLMRELDPESKPFLDECPTCHGRGVLYPSALVERIARVLCRVPLDADGHKFECFESAITVLDALNTVDASTEKRP